MKYWIFCDDERKFVYKYLLHNEDFVPVPHNVSNQPWIRPKYIFRASGSAPKYVLPSIKSWNFDLTSFNKSNFNSVSSSRIMIFLELNIFLSSAK